MRSNTGNITGRTSDRNMTMNSARSNGSGGSPRGSPRLDGVSVTGSKVGQHVYGRSKSTIGNYRGDDDGGQSSAAGTERKGVHIDRIAPTFTLRKDIHIHNWKAYKKEEQGKRTFLDDVARDAKKKLSPVLYAKIDNWAEMSQSKMNHGHALKDKFHPGQRVTFVEEAIKFDKRKHIPAPGVYNTLPKERVLQVPK